MRRRADWVLVVFTAVLVPFLLLGLCFIGLMVSPTFRRAVFQLSSPPSRGYATSGERIYYLGVDENRRRIPFEGGPMWLYMHGGSCVSCHGADGRGGRPVMMGTEIPPDIRYHHLIEEEHEEGEEHPPYADETIKRAITQGLNPAGEPLDYTMPRFRMTEEQLNDLLEFLKTLD